jgi:hypothetical protein
VRSKDAGGNEAASGNGVLTTAPAPPPTVPTYVQGATATGSGSGTSLARAFGSANGAGNLIVGLVSFDSSGGTPWSCSDTQGNMYAQAASVNDPRHSQLLGMCYAANVKAGANTVTVTYGGGARAWRALVIAEYSGVVGPAALDKVASNVGTGTAVTSQALVPTQNGDLIVSVVDVDDSSTPTFHAGAGVYAAAGVDLTVEDQVQATAGSIAGPHPEREPTTPPSPPRSRPPRSSPTRRRRVYRRG